MLTSVLLGSPKFARVVRRILVPPAQPSYDDRNYVCLLSDL